MRIGIKQVIKLGIHVVVLTILLFVCFTVASMVSGMADLPASADPSAGSGHLQAGQATDVAAAVDAGESLRALLVASLLESAVLTIVILRSRGSGWRLVGAVFLAFFGLNTVVTQIESIVFLPQQLPQGMIPKMFVMGAIQAGLFSPLAVLVLGKIKRGAMPNVPNQRPAMSPREWAWKPAAIAVAYVVLYLAFGYFVAWKNPAVRAYYGGTDPGNFFAQVASIWNATPWLFLFQAFRAMLWVLFALPVIRMHKGQRWEVALTVALLFTVWLSQLLLPNPYMPEAVARTHLIEMLPSNLIFGGLVGWLLSHTRQGFVV